MLNRIFGGGASSEDNQKPKGEPFILLVIQADDYDWQQIFKQQHETRSLKKKEKNDASSATNNDEGTTIYVKGNRPLRVIQTSWYDLYVGPCDNYSRDPRHRCMVTVRKIWKNGKSFEPTAENGIKNVTQAIFPDFVLVRNEVTVPQKDFTNKLLGLMYSNVPSINSLRSIYLSIERPVMMAALNKISNDLSKNDPENKMPLIPQQFFPGHSSMMYSQKFPAVVKFGSAHAGFGKMKVVDHHQMEDVQSVLPMTSSGYCFGEPFLTGECDLRLQRLGKGNYRAFKRVSVCGNWKTQTGTACIETIEVTKKYIVWLEAAAEMFGKDLESGKMEILTLDVLVEENTGAEYVLECNGTSSGLGEEKEATADNLILADLVFDEIAKL